MQQSQSYFGLELEAYITGGDIFAVYERIGREACEAQGISWEVFRYMIEFVSPIHERVEDAVEYVDELVQLIREHGFDILPEARMPIHQYLDPEMDLSVLIDDPKERKKKEEYMQWVFDMAKKRGRSLEDICLVGTHWNYSHSGWRDEQDLADAANKLRGMVPLFVLASSNSASSTARAERSLRWPFVYNDSWNTPEAYRAFIRNARKEGIVHPDSSRAYTTVAIRGGNDIEDAFTHIEVRAIEGGGAMLGAPLVGCGKLVERIALHGENRFFTAEEEQGNLEAVAQLGTKATIELSGRRYKVTEVAQAWFAGIPELEQILQEKTEQERYPERKRRVAAK